MPVVQPVGVDEVLAILRDGTDDDRLLGFYETRWLDFKGSPYRLDEPREQWELAKDIAALANSGGGCVVVGVHTEKDTARDEEHASKVAPFPVKLLDVKRHYDFLGRDIYPPIEGLTIEPFPRGEQTLLALITPEQDDDREPFLISRFVDEAGLTWRAFVLPRRSGSHTSFEPIGMIHRDIAEGRRARRMPAVAAAPSREPTNVDTQDAEALSEAAANEIDQALGWMTVAVVYLTAVPGDPRSRPRDFYAQDGFRRALSPRDQLRQSGFGLTYGHDITVNGTSVLAVDDDRAVLRVDASGFAVAGAAGTPAFLGWAQDQGRSPSPGAVLGVNPVALCEFTYEFCRFLEREMVPRWGGGAWTLTALVRRAQTAERPLALRTGYHDAWMAHSYKAEADDRLESLQASHDPRSDAIALLSVVYGVFGLGPEQIPFNKDGRFDEEQLLNLK